MLNIDYFVYIKGICSDMYDKSSYGIYFNDNDNRNVSEKVNIGCVHTTKNAELLGILKTYDIIKDDLNNNKKIGIVTDSENYISYFKNYSSHITSSYIYPNQELLNKIYISFKNYKNIYFIKYTNTNIKSSHLIMLNKANELANIDLKNQLKIKKQKKSENVKYNFLGISI